LATYAYLDMHVAVRQALFQLRDKGIV